MTATNVVEFADRHRPDPLPHEPLTELGYARRLIAEHGTRLRYVIAWKQWLIWDGTRWTPDETGQVYRWCKSIARRVTQDAKGIPDEKERRATLTLCRRGEAHGGVVGALALASTEEGVPVLPDDLDADPLLLNVENGTIDLRTRTLRDHDPADLLTKKATASYRPDAGGPEFSRFLARVQPDIAVREFLARLLGHALEGRVIAHILPIFYGVGANGKGTLTAAVIAALGDYADAADPTLLTARSYDAHPTGAADLYRLRLAVVHETEAGRRLAEATVKRLTGGDRIKARRMREDFWAFNPSHTFLMLTNHRPIVTGTDEGIWRRLRLIPWPVVIPPEEWDLELGDRLAGEADAILAWLVAGYADWKANGLGEPSAVTEATNAYRAESDAIGRFLDTRCLIAKAYHVGSTDLYAAWAAWCTSEGEESGTQMAFATALQNRGYENRKTRTGRMAWHGLALAAEESP